MNYIDTINGYAIYELSKATCKANHIEYPCFSAFLTDERPDPRYSDCDAETFDELAEWCEKN